MYITIREKKDVYPGVLRVGETYLLEPDPENPYEDEAIAVKSLQGACLGYVANSVRSVARGTHSAGYVYRDVHSGTKAVIRFIGQDCIIAEVLE